MKGRYSSCPILCTWRNPLCLCKANVKCYCIKTAGPYNYFGALCNSIIYKYTKIVRIHSEQNQLLREWSVMDLSKKKILDLKHFLAKYLSRSQWLYQNFTEKEEEEVEGVRKQHYGKNTLHINATFHLESFLVWHGNMPYDSRSEIKTLFRLLPHKNSSHPPQRAFSQGNLCELPNSKILVSLYQKVLRSHLRYPDILAV